jgi:peptidoglycan/LPS O-acetylase OafA/YrhL
MSETTGNTRLDQAATPRPAAADDRSAGELVKEVTTLVPRLVRDEIKLAQVEMTAKGKQMGIGAGAFAGSGLVALYAVGCLLACAIIALSNVVPAWLAALIVGVVLLAVAGVAALIGKSRLSKGSPPVPKEAIDSAKADVQEVKEKAHR